jgi:N-acetylneuraminic acid mutarotase
MKRRIFLIGFLCLLIAVLQIGSAASFPDSAIHGPPPGGPLQAGGDDPPPPSPPDDPPLPATPVTSFGDRWTPSTLGSTDESMLVSRVAGNHPKVGQQASPPNGDTRPLAAPANDDFDHALVIGATPYVSEIDTVGATVAGDDPFWPCGSRTTPQQSSTVWYRFEASHNGRLHVDTDGSDYDTVVAIWMGSRGVLTNVGCNDDYYVDLTSRLEIDVVEGTTYHIAIAGFGPLGGGFLHLKVDFRLLGGHAAWSLVADLPKGRDRLAVVSDGNYVYAIGGREYETSLQASRSVQRYDPLVDSWLGCAPLPAGYSNIGAAYLNGKIYIPAGYDHSDSLNGTHYVYSVSENAWTTASPAPWASTTITPVIHYAVAADPLNNAYYVTGGFNGYNATQELLHYDVDADTWTTLAPMQRARHGHEAALINGMLYVAGGGNASWDGVGVIITSTNTVEVYDPNTNSWSYTAFMKADRLYAADGSGVSLPPSFCSKTYGNWDGETYLARDHDSGNIFFARSSATLSEIRFHLEFASLTDMYFFVYESDALQGSYNRIHETHISRTGTGEGWYSSGPIAVSLAAGHYYYVGASWNGWAWFGTAPGDVPISTAAPCLGSFQTGADSLAEYPPEPHFTNSTSGLVPVHMHLEFSSPAKGLWCVTGGGRSSHGTFLNTTEVYDPAANQWTLLDEKHYNLHEPRYFFDGAVTGAGEFYVVGGYNGDNCDDGGCLSDMHERLGEFQSIFLPAVCRGHCGGDDPYEPNDGFGQAYEIPSGDDYQGNFACDGDVNDVFRFEMSAAHTIEIWLSDIPPGSNFSLALYDGDKQRVTYSAKPNNADEHILTEAKGPGTYYIQVYNQGGTYGTGVTWRLRAVFQ